MLTPLLAMTLLAAPPADPDVGFLRAYSETRGFTAGLPKHITPTPDGRWVLFLRSGATSPVQSLFAFDVARGRTVELLSAEALLAGAAQTLSTTERAELERKRISARGLTGFELSDDGRSLVTVLSGRVYRVDVEGLAGGKLSNALFRAGRPHQFMPLSGFTHMVADPVELERELALQLDFIRAHLPPAGSPAAGSVGAR